MKKAAKITSPPFAFAISLGVCVHQSSVDRFEGCIEFVANCAKSSDGGNGDERSDQAIFNGRRALFVFEHLPDARRSEEHTSELQSLMRISYAVLCLTKKKNKHT